MSYTHNTLGGLVYSTGQTYTSNGWGSASWSNLDYDLTTRKKLREYCQTVFITKDIFEEM